MIFLVIVLLENSKHFSLQKYTPFLFYKTLTTFSSASFLQFELFSLKILKSVLTNNFNDFL